MIWPWSELGLPGPADLSAVKHAYAQRLKTTHPEEDPEGFQRLHEAYQAASRMARRQARCPAPPPETEGCSSQGERPPVRQEPPPAGEAWDFESLLEEAPGEKDSGQQDQQGPSDDFDFEQLLNRREGAQRPREQENPTPEWDFEALLDQGDWEREEALRRRAQERLDQARQRRTRGEQSQTERARREDAAWQAAFAALHAVELLHAQGDSYEHWWEFLHGTTFRNAQHNLDFVFGLEDFLTEHPLPKHIRQAIAVAYEFDRRLLNQAYLPLYRLLTGRKKPPRFIPGVSTRSRKLGRRTWPAILLLGLLAVAVIVFPLLEHLDQGGVAANLSAQTLRRYLEEDFQVSLEDQGTLPGKDWVHIFSLADDPTLRFQAMAKEERDPERGLPGYDCNYPGVLVYRAMAEFAQEQGWPLYFDLDYLDQQGLSDEDSSPPRTFVLQLPLTGGEEGIAALGALLEGLEEKGWYDWMPPDFWVYLTREGSVLFQYDSSQDFRFNTDEALSVYERFGVSYTWYLLEELEIPRWDLEEGYLLALKGEAETPAGTCWWVEAHKNGQVIDYYLTRDGSALYCLPEGTPVESVFVSEPHLSLRLPTGAALTVYHPDPPEGWQLPRGEAPVSTGAQQLSWRGSGMIWST